MTAGRRHFTDRAAESLRPDQQAGRRARAGGMQINITFVHHYPHYQEAEECGGGGRVNHTGCRQGPHLTLKKF